VQSVFPRARRDVISAAAALPAVAPGTVAARGAELSVPYVPTPLDVVNRILMAQISRNDYLTGPGSGDGPIVFAAARMYGARGFGVGLSPRRVAEAKANARAAAAPGKVASCGRDRSASGLIRATIVKRCLLPGVSPGLLPWLAAFKVRTRVAGVGDWRATRIAFRLLAARSLAHEAR